MTEHEPTSRATPLDAEREKLHATGYTESEISQILISRATGASSASAGPGTMSNVIGSFVAVAGYAAGLFLGFRADATTLFDAGAKSGARVAAALALTFKLVVIGVLGYGAWQEWRQHIISATEIAKSQARKIRAEECSARMKMIVDTIAPANWGPAMEGYNKDCDPTYAARAKACDKRFQAILDDMDKLSIDDFKARVESHKADCDITPEQRDEAARKIDEVKAQHDAKVKEVTPDLLRGVNEEQAANSDHKAGNYASAFAHAQNYLSIVEAVETKIKSGPGKLTAGACVGLSWHALFVKKFADAASFADRAVQLDPPEVIALINKAHALMFLGRTDEARALYLAHRGEKIDDKRTWEDGVTGDFAELRKAGLSDPLIDEVTRDLSGQESAAARRRRHPRPSKPHPRPIPRSRRRSRHQRPRPCERRRPSIASTASTWALTTLFAPRRSRSTPRRGLRTLIKRRMRRAAIPSKAKSGTGSNATGRTADCHYKAALRTIKSAARRLASEPQWTAAFASFRRSNRSPVSSSQFRACRSPFAQSVVMRAPSLA